jgi:hypothetical protein
MPKGLDVRMAVLSRYDSLVISKYVKKPKLIGKFFLQKEVFATSYFFWFFSNWLRRLMEVLGDLTNIQQLI